MPSGRRWSDPGSCKCCNQPRWILRDIRRRARHRRRLYRCTAIRDHREWYHERSQYLSILNQHYQLVLTVLSQERLLTVTNTFEGTVFVNSEFSAEMTTAEYVTQLFPNFNSAEISAAAAQYTNVSDLPTVNDQAIAIMGECE